MKNTDSVPEINHLLERTRETELSYLKAIELVHDAELRQRFATFAHQRYAFGLDLKKRILHVEQAASTGRVQIKLQNRYWSRIQSFISSITPDEVILSHFIEGETRALADYKAVINHFTSQPRLQQIFVRHYKGIRHILDKLNSLQNF